MMMQRELAVLVALSILGCGVRGGEAPQPIRVRFVPVDTHAESGGGASFTQLAPAPSRPGALFAIVHAGLKDEFPIQDTDGEVLFRVVVPEATDERFVLDIRVPDGARRIELRRDEPVTVEVTGQRFEFHYPTCHVNPDAKATTSKALILVTRLPQP